MPPKSTKSVATKSVTPVPDPLPDVSPEVEVQPVSSSEVEADKFSQVLEKLQSVLNDAKELMVLVKVLQKDHVKLQKQSVKKVKRSTGGDGAVKRSPSGFAKPTKLSDELCDFLGVTKGSAMARTIVTKHINEYIKKNKLQDVADKRHIIPDNKLNAILSLKEGDKLTYFNLQTFIKQHFKKD